MLNHKYQKWERYINSMNSIDNRSTGFFKRI
jgi:hypothetical protein